MSSLVRRFLFVAVLCAPTLPAAAQVVAVQPPNPTSVDTLVASVNVFHSSYRFHSVQVSGSVVTIRFEDRLPWNLPAGRRENVTIGQLPPGTYTLYARYVTYGEDEVTVVDDYTASPFTLVVAAGHFIPALDWRGLALLGAALALTALVTIARR